MTVYMPVQQIGIGGRLFVRAAGDPYALVPAVTRVVRELSAEQPLERARDARGRARRAAVAGSPERVRVLGIRGYRALIAVVGVAGVLAFSVSARTREFGIRMAVGSAPAHLLRGVLSEGVVIAASGLRPAPRAAMALRKSPRGSSITCSCPASCRGGCVVVLIAAAVVASLIPAARASHVDVIQALRSE